jgi:chromosome partitioning protein
MPVITFANSKGGVGKSTAALITAQVLVKQGAPTTVIDADPNQPLAKWSKRDPDNCPSSLNVIGNVTEETILDVIDDAAIRDPFVIIDLEGSRNVTVSYAIGRSDVVIIPMQGSQLDADEAAQVIKLIKREEKAFGRKIPFFVLFTRTNVIEARDVKHVRNELADNNIPVLKVSLAERSAYRTIFQLGGSLYDLTSAEVASPRKATENAEAYVKILVDEIRKLGE